MDSGERCDNCRFWMDLQDTIVGEDGRGICKRNPPALISATDDRHRFTPPDWEQPVTHDFNWCGEWQPNDASSDAGSSVTQQSTPIDCLEMNGTGATRAYKVLYWLGIRTIEQLRETPRLELFSAKNCGCKTVNLIIESLEEYDKRNANKEPG